MNAARFVLVKGLSSSTNQRNHTGQGILCRDEANRQTTAIAATTETSMAATSREDMAIVTR